MRARNRRFLTSCLVLEGGFDEEGNFVYIPFSSLQKMTEYFRRKVINLFLKDEMINEDFARNLLSWMHSGFSIDNSVQILTDKARVNLSEYISKAPVSLKKLNVIFLKRQAGKPGHG